MKIDHHNDRQLAEDEYDATEHMLEMLRQGNQLVDRARLPRRHMYQACQTVGPWWDTLCGLHKQLGSGMLVALVGGRAVGKTQMAVELCRSTCQKRMFSALYVTATEMFMMFKDSYRVEGRGELAVMAELLEPGLLVIDEFEKRRQNEWEWQLVFELLNKRYNAVADTVLISNQSKGEFEDMAGPSLCSRIGKAGGIIVCDWGAF